MVKKNKWKQEQHHLNSNVSINIKFAFVSLDNDIRKWEVNTFNWSKSTDRNRDWKKHQQFKENTSFWEKNYEQKMIKRCCKTEM